MGPSTPAEERRLKKGKQKEERKGSGQLNNRIAKPPRSNGKPRSSFLSSTLTSASVQAQPIIDETEGARAPSSRGRGSSSSNLDHDDSGAPGIKRSVIADGVTVDIPTSDIADYEQSACEQT